MNIFLSQNFNTSKFINFESMKFTLNESPDIMDLIQI